MSTINTIKWYLEQSYSWRHWEPLSSFRQVLLVSIELPWYDVIRFPIQNFDFQSPGVDSNWNHEVSMSHLKMTLNCHISHDVEVNAISAQFLDSNEPLCLVYITMLLTILICHWLRSLRPIKNKSVKSDVKQIGMQHLFCHECSIRCSATFLY